MNNKRNLIKRKLRIPIKSVHTINLVPHYSVLTSYSEDMTMGLSSHGIWEMEKSQINLKVIVIK